MLPKIKNKGNLYHLIYVTHEQIKVHEIENSLCALEVSVFWDYYPHTPVTIIYSQCIISVSVACHIYMPVLSKHMLQCLFISWLFSSCVPNCQHECRNDLNDVPHSQFFKVFFHTW